MKLIHKVLFVVAAISTAMFVSCNKNNNPYDDDDKYIAPPIETPVYADAATVITFNQNQPVTKSGDKIKSIEFTESGYAVIVEEALVAGPTAITKAGGSENVVVLKYTFKSGVYNIPGFGNVAISGTTVTITATPDDDAVSTEVGADVEKGQTPSGVDTDLFSSWKIVTTNVKISGQLQGSSYNFDHKFEGNKASSLYEMAKYINEKKNNVIDKPEQYQKYTVVAVTMSKNKGFLVTFTGADPFYGAFTLAGQSFSYSIATEGNFAFSAEATGSVKIDSETHLCVLTLNGGFKSGNDNLTTEITLEMEQIKEVK